MAQKVASQNEDFSRWYSDSDCPYGLSSFSSGIKMIKEAGLWKQQIPFTENRGT